MYAPFPALSRLIQSFTDMKLIGVGAFSALWSAVEINVCIICCCLPAIKPLLSRKWPRIFGNGSAPIGGNPHNMQADLRTIGGSGGSAPARNSARDSYALTYVEHTKGSSGRSHGSRSSGKSMGAFTGSGSDTFNRGDSQVNMGLSDDEYHENESEGDTRTGARNGYLRDNAGASEERILSNVEELEDLRLKNNNKSESIPSGGGLRH